MGIPMDRAVVILLASGRSRRFGWRDKLLHKLEGKPLLDYAADAAASLDALARVAVCPHDHPKIAERLHGRFVVAVNDKPGRGMGHSIAVGMKVALQFKPDAVVICMADMPFVEPQIIANAVAALGGAQGVNIAHSGNLDGPRPPTAFDATCFGVLAQLDGDEGARDVMRQARFKTVALKAPEPLLTDIDTGEDFEHARELMAVRARHLGKVQAPGL
jgi:molybdenum cofactor cytidylyltransferase